NRVISKAQSPSSVFFEKDKNNIYIGDAKSSILESFNYKHSDEKFASFYNLVYNAPKSEALDRKEFAGMLSSLIADFSFRTPALEAWAAQQTSEALKKQLPERIRRLIDATNRSGYSEVDRVKMLNVIGPAILVHTNDQEKML